MTMALTIGQGAGAAQVAEKTFEDYVEEWLAVRSQADNDDAEANDEDIICKRRALKQKSVATYRYALKVFKDFLDDSGIAHPDERAINSYRKFMTAKKWSVSTKNMYLAAVRSFYRWLADTYPMKNIAADFQGWQSSKEHKRGTLNLSEMKKLLASVVPVIQEKLEQAKNQSQKKRLILQGLRDKAILAALMAGGLRTIEISRLRIADLISDSGVNYLNVLGKGKDEPVLVKISSQAAAVIRDWLNARESVDTVTNASPLFCSIANNSFGEELSTHAISTLCKNYLRTAELKEKSYAVEGNKKSVVKPIVAHSLRASLATQSFLNGASLEEVKQQLRHENIATTLLYIEEAKKSLNRCSDIISDAIF